MARAETLATIVAILRRSMTRLGLWKQGCCIRRCLISSGIKNVKYDRVDAVCCLCCVTLKNESAYTHFKDKRVTSRVQVLWGIPGMMRRIPSISPHCRLVGSTTCSYLGTFPSRVQTSSAPFHPTNQTHSQTSLAVAASLNFVFREQHCYTLYRHVVGKPRNDWWAIHVPQPCTWLLHCSHFFYQLLLWLFLSVESGVVDTSHP